MPESPLLRRLRDRHLEYYSALVAAHTDDPHWGRSKPRPLIPHYDNIRAALRWALENGRCTEAGTLCLALHYVWLAGNRVREAENLLAEALACKDNAPSTHARLEMDLGDIQLSNGRYTEARASHDRALARFRELGDDVWAWRARLGIAWSHWFAGSFQEALAEAESVLEQQSVAAHPVDVARALEAKGWALLKLGRAAEARSALSEGTAILQDSDFSRDLGEHLTVRSHALESLGDIEEAERLREQALVILRQQDPDPVELATELWSIAIIKTKKGDAQEAETLLREALLLVAGRDAVREAAINSSLGDIAFDQGDVDQAWERYVQAKDLWDSTTDMSARDRRIRAGVEANLALISFEKGDVSTAEARYEQFGDRLKTVDEVSYSPAFFALLALRAENRGDVERAVHYWLRLNDAPLQKGEHEGGWLRVRARANAYRLRGQYDQARDVLRASREDGTVVDGTESEALMLFELAKVERDDGNLSASEEHALRAAEVVGALSVGAGVARCQLLIAEVRTSAGRRDEAKATLMDLRQRWRDIPEPMLRADFAVMLAGVYEEQEPEFATRLLAAATAFRERSGYRPRSRDDELDQLTGRLRRVLGDRFSAIWDQAHLLGVSEILGAG